MIHQRKHPALDVDGCYGCKISSVRLNTDNLTRERDGRSPTGGSTTREYVKRMYEKRRAAGQPDPEPVTKEAAAFAPAAGVARPKNYKKINGGL